MGMLPRVLKGTCVYGRSLYIGHVSGRSWETLWAAPSWVGAAGGLEVCAGGTPLNPVLHYGGFLYGFDVNFLKTKTSQAFPIG